MENTDGIKDMITLIEENNEQYYDALRNLADRFDKSLSENLRKTIALEMEDNRPVTAREKWTGSKNPVIALGRLFSRKSLTV